MARLQEKHAILTGAGGGIGLAVAAAYLKEGAHCTVADISATPSAKLAALMTRYPETLMYAAADVTLPSSVERLIERASQTFGPVDVLFNNAALFDMAPLLDSESTSKACFSPCKRCWRRWSA